MTVRDELEALRRALAAAPDDEALRRRYEAALAREGRRSELVASLALRVMCPQRWVDMRPLRLEKRPPQSAGPGAAVRFCESCQERVYWAFSSDGIRAHAEAGRCIAAPTWALEEYIGEDLAPSEDAGSRLHLGRPKLHSPARKARP